MIDLTHKTPPSNNFNLKQVGINMSEQAAAALARCPDAPIKVGKAGMLARVKFDQWHVIPRIRHKVPNAKAQALAGLLAALARMDCTHYEISQNEIAARLGALLQMEKPPTRQAVARWEKMLCDVGLIEIPRAAGRGQGVSKRRAFSPIFIKMANWRNPNKPAPTPPKMSDNDLHATKDNSPSTSDQSNTTPYLEHTNNIIVTELRAKKTKGETRNNNPAQDSLKKSTRANTNNLVRPPKFDGNPKHPPRHLSKFQRSFLHWLGQNWHITSQAEGHLIMAEFLRREHTDDMIQNAARSWGETNDRNERPAIASSIVKHLQRVMADEQAAADKARKEHAEELESLVGFIGGDNDQGGDPVADGRQQMRLAMLGLADDYNGPCQHIVERFKVAGDSEQDSLLDQLGRGAFDQFF